MSCNLDAEIWLTTVIYKICRIKEPGSGRGSRGEYDICNLLLGECDSGSRCWKDGVLVCVKGYAYNCKTNVYFYTLVCLF